MCVFFSLIYVTTVLQVIETVNFHMSFCILSNGYSPQRIRAFLRNAHWHKLAQLRFHWTHHELNTWRRKYIREAVKHPWRICCWIAELERAEQTLKITPRCKSQWPIEKRSDLINCLFVLKAFGVVLSGMFCVVACERMKLCPTVISELIQEFIGQNPVGYVRSKQTSLNLTLKRKRSASH